MKTTEAQAREMGYTLKATAEPIVGDTLSLLIKPGTDLDTNYPAYDIDTGEMLRVRGWLVETTVEVNGRMIERSEWQAMEDINKMESDS